jgi:hypothetical protein
MSRNKCFLFPGSNITCFTFYILLWPIYWLSLLSTHLHPGLSSSSFICIFLPKLCMHFYPIRAIFLAHLSLPDWIILIIFAERCKLWRSLQLSRSFSHFLPVRSKHSPQHPVLKHPQSMSLLNVKNQVWHPHKIISKITVLYILSQYRLWEGKKIRAKERQRTNESIANAIWRRMSWRIDSGKLQLQKKKNVRPLALLTLSREHVTTDEWIFMKHNVVECY